MYETPQLYEGNIVEPAIVLGIPTEQSRLYKKPLDDHEPKLNEEVFNGVEQYQMGAGEEIRKSITHLVVQTGLEILKKAGGG